MMRQCLVFGTVLFTLAIAGCGRYTKAQVTEYCRSHPEACQDYCEAHPGACQPYLGGQSGSGFGGIVGTGGVTGTGGATVVPDASPPLGPEPGPEPALDAAPVTPDAPPPCLYSLSEDGDGCVSTCYQTVRPAGIGDKLLVKIEGSPQLYMVLNGGHLMIPVTVQVAMQWKSNCLSPVVASPETCRSVIQIAAADVVSFYRMTVLEGVHVPPRPGTSVLVYDGKKYVDGGYTPGLGRVVLHELVPPTLESLIFTDAAAVQQPIPPEEFGNMYLIGTPITAASQYISQTMCSKVWDVIPESSFLFPPPF